MEKWANAAELLSEEIEWAYLNDDGFSFDPEWQRVYEILPEIADPMDGSNRREREPHEWTLPQFKAALHSSKRKYPDGWKENPQRYIENEATRVQRNVTVAYILIADQEAFQTDHLRLLYVDYKLNIIRESRVEADDTTPTDVIMDWDQAGMSPDSWEQSIGEKYRVDGESGAPLYQLAEEDWADPKNDDSEDA